MIWGKLHRAYITSSCLFTLAFLDGSEELGAYLVITLSLNLASARGNPKATNDRLSGFNLVGFKNMGAGSRVNFDDTTAYTFSILIFIGSLQGKN